MQDKSLGCLEGGGVAGVAIPLFRLTLPKRSFLAIVSDATPLSDLIAGQK